MDERQTSVEIKGINRVIKRDGSVANFDHERITNAIFKAAKSVGGTDHQEATKLTKLVLEELAAQKKKIPTVEEIQDITEKVLIKAGHASTAKAYILYRAKRAQLRQEAEDSEQGNDEVKTKLLKMFAHKSKLVSIMGYDRIDAYKKLLFYLKNLQKAGEIPVHPTDYLNNNELATSFYKGKYFLKDIDVNLIEEKPEDVFARLAAFMAAVEPDEARQKEWAIKFYTSLYNGEFLPGGRVIAGAGDLYRLKTLANCFVSLIDDDNIESIYKSAYECARTYSYGGGIGVDISVLRPKDAVVHNAADNSTGSVSFMELFSLTTGLIGQSGRRGALMLTIDVKHPDAPYFCNVKKIPNWVTNQIVQQAQWSGKFDEDQLKEVEKAVKENTQVRFANISLKVSDEFMSSVEEQNKYGTEKVLLYKKDKDVSNVSFQQSSNLHYSHGIPSKPIEKYELLGSYDSVEELNKALEQYKTGTLSEEELNDKKFRDAFGDFILSVPDADYDLAVKKSGDFMLYFNSRQTGEIKNLVKVRDIWNSFVEGNYKTAEPGLIFWSTMSKYSPSNYVKRPIVSTNPCGEVPLEDGGACNLGSINFSRFVKNGYDDSPEVDWHGIKESTKVLTRFLDNVVTWNEILNPLEKQRNAASETRRLGIGIMGIADMLNQLGLDYDSTEGIEIIEKASVVMANSAYQSSADLALEKGPSPIFDFEAYKKGAFFNEALTEQTKEEVRKKGLRNIAILSIAPTGTISNIILGFTNREKNYIGVSGGIEPIFALYYTRRSESFGNRMFKVFHSTVDAYLDKKNLKEKALNASNSDELKDILPKHFFRTAHYINPSNRVDIQGRVQKYIDHSISSTVNLPEDINPEVISNIYLDSWKKGLKGITIYRDGSRHPILSVEQKKSEFQRTKEDLYEVTINGETLQLTGDSVFVTTNGSLSTPYHEMKANNPAVKPLTQQQTTYTQVVEKKEETEEQIEQSEDVVLHKCVSCGKNTMKMENGCKTCIDQDCGYSQCDI